MTCLLILAGLLVTAAVGVWPAITFKPDWF